MPRALALLVLAIALGCGAARRPLFAESAIRGADARADVAWLADPARTGRGVGTPGNATAASWIAERMKEFGLTPGEPGGYLQPFDAPVRATLRGKNTLSVGSSSPALELDWQPFTFSESGSVSGELVWAGHGITAPELSHDDYAGLEAQGKVVLVAAHFPRERDTGSPFRAPDAYHYGEWRYKVLNARDHGAVAFIGVSDDWAHPGPGVLSAWQGTVSAPAGIPAVRITVAAAAAAGADARALAAASEEDGRPHSRPLGIAASMAVGIAQERAGTANVVGLLPGADPAHQGQCVVVGAHFDHLGLGGETSLAPEQAGQVHPGADDNASGTAAMLAIARAFAREGPRPRTIAFVAFSGEEMGLLGSSRFVREPPAACPIDKMQLMVNLDMVGRPQKGTLYVEGGDTARGLRARVDAAARQQPTLPLGIVWGAGDGYGPSDHTSFHAKGVPVLFLFTGAHADYHRPSDTADKVDAEGLAAVARLGYRVAAAAAETPEQFERVRTTAPPGRERGERSERERSYGAYLGTIPEFAERTEPGVLLSAARPGSPAEKAGLGAGDVILQIEGRPVRNLEDLVHVLRSHRPGDEVEVVWLHGSEIRRSRVTLEERR